MLKQYLHNDRRYYLAVRIVNLQILKATMANCVHFFYFIRHVLYIMIAAFHALGQILPSGHYKLRSIATTDAFTSYFTGYLFLYSKLWQQYAYSVHIKCFSKGRFCRDRKHISLYFLRNVRYHAAYTYNEL